MLRTLQEHQKADWKAYVSTRTHAYNAAIHDRTSFSPYYLMFGRHPRLAMDAFLGIRCDHEIPKSRQDYSDRLKDRLQFAYKKASEEAKKTSEKYKRYYDQKVRHAVLEPGDRVLVRNVGLKLADKWQKHPYVVTNQPIPDIPIYEVKKENSIAKPKLLHRNMLLPFVVLPGPDEEKGVNPPRDKRNIEKELEIDLSLTIRLKNQAQTIVIIVKKRCSCVLQDTNFQFEELETRRRIETRQDEVIAWRNNLSEEDRHRDDLQRDFRLAKEIFKQKNMSFMLTKKMSFLAEKFGWTECTE